jgi:predicted transcriptional regulator
MTPEEKLKIFFKSKGLKNKDVAKIIGYSESMTSAYLGYRKINLEFLQSIIKNFPDIDLNHILKDENQTKNISQIIQEMETNIRLLKENLTRK